MDRKQFKQKLKEYTYSNFDFRNKNMKIYKLGNLMQLDNENNWIHVDTGKYSEREYRKIIKYAEEGAIIIWVESIMN